MANTVERVKRDAQASSAEADSGQVSATDRCLDRARGHVEDLGDVPYGDKE